MKKGLLVLLISVLFANSYAQQILMQGWYWDYPKTTTGQSWADTLRLKAASLKQAGITHIWTPPYFPASFGAGSNGYDPKDLFIGNTTTGVGTRAALNAMMAEFAAQGIAPVADMIYNHRDGGTAENNPAVKAYITNYYTAAKEPFPSDRFRCALPLGGTSGNGAGDYYFKISSKTGDARFNGKAYKVYMQTAVKGYQNLPALTETEPNGGGDCGQGNNDIVLGVDMNATVETGGSCNTDEFHLNLTASDFNAAGDTLFIYLTNPNGNYSDHRIYGLYSAARSADIASEVLYQTYTNFNGLPSGRGQMNYNFFKPNDANASTTYLNGDWDGMYFFYDYDQFQPQTRDTLIAWTKWNWTELGVRGLRMDAVKHFTPSYVSDMLNSLNADGMNPSLVVGEWYSTNTSELSGWVNNVLNGMNASAKAAIQPKIFDFTLRDNLRKACDEGLDTRNIYSGGLHDGGGLSGFNVVTFVNNHDFRDASGFASLIRNNPNLAYAYILTNNQLGVPTIYYPDYYGYPAPNGGLYSYHPTNQAPLHTELDKIMQVMKQYINGSPSVDYLNRFSTPYASNYISGGAGNVLIYQLRGTVANGNKDVIVAINFGSAALKVDHEINVNGGAIPPGTQFTDVLGRSAFPYALVNGSNQIYMELPAKSYSVWVQGTATVLPLQLLRFDAKAVNKVVQLQWTVAQNEEVKSFEIERAEDGVHFEKVGSRLSINKAGNSDYDFVDATPKKGIGLLYRIKLIGKDGSSVYSDLKMVRVEEGQLALRLKQNPVQGSAALELTSAVAGKATITVVSSSGQKLFSQSINLVTGVNEFSFPTQAYAKGVYRLLIEAGNERKTISFLKE